MNNTLISKLFRSKIFICKKMNKKGVFFTVIALAVISLALVTFFNVPSQDLNAVSTRIFTLDKFLKETEKDLDRALYISSFRAILALEQHIISTGVFLDDVEPAFSVAIVNGTYSNYTLELVQNATLKEWLSRINTQADKIGAKLNITFTGISIEHTSPWVIKSSINASISLYDSTAANFTKNYTATSELSIIGFEDPIYPLYTYGRVINVINRTPFTYFVSGNDITNLLAHVTNSYYIAHTDAPSFLMRLEGNLSGSQYGVESLVNLPELETSLPRSVVDYVYFGQQQVTDYNIQGMPSWFRLDAAHLDVYEVESLIS